MSAPEMTFGECVVFCAQQDGFVAQWERLTGHSFRGIAKASPIEREIDKATGRYDDVCAAFCAFVYECVWTRGDWRDQ